MTKRYALPNDHKATLAAAEAIPDEHWHAMETVDVDVPAHEQKMVGATKRTIERLPAAIVARGGTVIQRDDGKVGRLEDGYAALAEAQKAAARTSANEPAAEAAAAPSVTTKKASK